eukprot:9669300-Karenia_brevis.AAC.1
MLWRPAFSTLKLSVHERYDARTTDALNRWLEDVPHDLHDEVRSALQDAADAAVAWWRDDSTHAG